MTAVDILCLNHRTIYNSGFSFDETNDILPICRNSLHHWYSFYTTIRYPYFIAWMYPKSHFDFIQEAIYETNKRVTTRIAKRQLDKFMTDWKYIINEEILPEFTFLRPRKKNVDLSQFKLRRSLLRKNPSFDNLISKIKISDKLTIDEDTLVKQAKVAKDRTQACIHFRFLNRDFEEDFFKEINKMLSSDFQEQRWISLIALHFYLFGKIHNPDLLLKVIKANLFDNYYIIRQESFDLLLSLFVSNPKLGFELNRRLIRDKNPELSFLGVKLLSEFLPYVYPGVGHGHRWINLKTKFKKYLIKKIIDDFLGLTYEANEVIIKYIERLVDKETHWKNDNRAERLTDRKSLGSDLLNGFSWMIRNVNWYLFDPFKHYYE